MPISRKLSNHGLSLLGGGSSRSSNATSAAGGALAEQPPPREPFARQHSDSNLVSLGLGRQRSTSGAGTMAGGGGRWFDRRGSSRKSAIDKSEKRLRGSNTSQCVSSNFYDGPPGPTASQLDGGCLPFIDSSFRSSSLSPFSSTCSSSASRSPSCRLGLARSTGRSHSGRSCSCLSSSFRAFRAGC